MRGDGSIDERLAFLACAGARLLLIEEGLLSIDEAFDPAFVERFRKIGRLTCHCERETLRRFDAEHRTMHLAAYLKWQRGRS
jgi:hypothetical protein